MNSLLPTYWNYNTLESLSEVNKGRWEWSFFAKNDNKVPIIQSDWIKSNIQDIDSILLLKLDENDLTKVKGQTSLSISDFIFIENSVKNNEIHSIVYSKNPYEAIEISELKGIFQIKATFDTGDILYSDIFKMAGIPVAVYACSDATFNNTTEKFNITITRTDSDPLANSLQTLYLSCLNTLENLTVYETDFDVNIAVGGDPVILELDTSLILNVFDKFQWVGLCNGNLEFNGLLTENSIYFNDENNNNLIEN